MKRLALPLLFALSLTAPALACGPMSAEDYARVQLSKLSAALDDPAGLAKERAVREGFLRKGAALAPVGESDLATARALREEVAALLAKSGGLDPAPEAYRQAADKAHAALKTLGVPMILLRGAAACGGARRPA